MNQPLKDALLELEAELNHRLEVVQIDIMQSREDLANVNFHLGELEQINSFIAFARHLKGKFGA